LNDIRQDAIEVFNISEYHGYPCQPNPCTANRICQQIELNNYTCHTRYEHSNINNISIELDGKQNLVYSYLPTNLNRNYFKLSFKTKHSDGLIFFISDTTSTVFSQYLSLIIVNGFIQFTVKIDKSSNEVSLISKIRVDDGQWHRIELERFVYDYYSIDRYSLILRFRRRITMKLDDNYPRRAVSLSKLTEFRPYPPNIYIGSDHRLCNHNEQHCRAYRGCLKSFFIDKYFLDLFNDEMNQHHSLKSCQSIAG
jgi:hypothetical protein